MRTAAIVPFQLLRMLVCNCFIVIGFQFFERHFIHVRASMAIVRMRLNSFSGLIIWMKELLIKLRSTGKVIKRGLSDSSTTKGDTKYIS